MNSYLFLFIFLYALQTLSGISVTDFPLNGSAYKAFRLSVAVTLNVNVTYVTLGKASAGPTTISLQQSIYSIFVPYTVSIPSTVYSVSSYQNKLSTAVNTGAFTSTLQTNAKTLNATSLYSTTSTSLEFGNMRVIQN